MSGFSVSTAWQYGRVATTGSASLAPGFEPVARAFEQAAGSGGGGALVVRRDGETLVSLSRGIADAEGRPWSPDTPALSFSTTKGLASTVIHRLADRGEVDLDAPVADLWPEFGAGGKGAITVRDVMTHRAGLYDVRRVARRAEDLLDHLEMEERLAAEPSHRTRRPAYHAITYGWLVAGIARRVTGLGMRELVERELAEPLGTDGLHIGRPPGHPARIMGLTLHNYARVAEVTSRLWGRLPQARATAGALFISGFHRLFEGESPPIWDTEMPAVNGFLSAAGLARLYGALANGGSDSGRRLLSAEAVAELGRVQSRDRDAVLGVPMRWRSGYHQAFGAGRGSSRSFGHYGYAGSGGWADPVTGISLGFVTNRVSRITTPIGDIALFRLSAAVRRSAMGGGQPPGVGREGSGPDGFSGRTAPDR